MTRKGYGERRPELPLHPAVRAGDFIFVSGQVPRDERGALVRGTIEDETRHCIEQVRRALQGAGADLEDVVKATVFLADAADFRAYNAVFARYFPEALLARTTVEARAVVSVKIEIDAIAYKPAAAVSP